jgi:hypothetical protein
VCEKSLGWFERLEPLTRFLMVMFTRIPRCGGDDWDNLTGWRKGQRQYGNRSHRRRLGRASEPALKRRSAG